MSHLYLYKVISHIYDRYSDHHIVLNDPDIIYAEQYKNDYEYDLGHNKNGVSIILESRVVWTANNKEVSTTKEFCHLHNMSGEDTLFYHLTYGDKLPSMLDEVHPDHNPLITLPLHRTLT